MPGRIVHAQPLRVDYYTCLRQPRFWLAWLAWLLLIEVALWLVFSLLLNWGAPWTPALIGGTIGIGSSLRRGAEKAATAREREQITT
jgi:phosphate/sulfate permease